MPWTDLRSYLAYLEEKGDLVHISNAVSTRFEVAAYARKSSDSNGPAFMFDNVTAYPGWRVLGALYGSPGRIVDGLQSDRKAALHLYIRSRTDRIQPRMVDCGECQEVVHTGAEVDLYQLPVCTHAERDAGPFITAGVAVVKDPASGARLLGIHRMQLHGKERLGIFADSPRIRRAVADARERGQRLEIAVAIGVVPAVAIGSVTKVDYGVDKFGVAGALQGSPIDLVKCRTVDVEVPATSEIVIEGEIPPMEKQIEAPFGEFPGTYCGKTESPIVKVKAITHRKNPIYQTLLAGMPTTENHLMLWLPRAAEVYEAARMGCPEVVDLRMRGNQEFDTVIAVRKRLDREGLNVIMSVLGSTGVKYCTVVDDDIDIYNDRDILWAMETRVQPDKDVHIFPMMVGAPLDPSTSLKWQTSKMGMDATLPSDADREKFAKVLVPGVDQASW